MSVRAYGERISLAESLGFAALGVAMIAILAEAVDMPPSSQTYFQTYFA
jgi:hypothetical protein